jgi:hypothetical protein
MTSHSVSLNRPVAEVIVEYAAENDLEKRLVDNFKSVTGKAYVLISTVRRTMRASLDSSRSSASI